jgi:hypothetical protein
LPKIALAIGQMDLENDQTSKKDTVLAHLINGFRVGTSIHMWPDHAEYCDLGINGKVYIWRSTLHNVMYAVCGGNLYRINGEGDKTDITGASLTAGIPPTFTEDRHSVYVAAKSPIYKISGNQALVNAGGQAPINVTSLAYLSGFLVANGDDPAGGGLPGDFAYSDTIGGDGVPTYATWSYENNASKPDGLQGLIATPEDYLYAIGTESVDVSYISGNVENPFASNKAASQSFGTPSPHAIAYDSQSVYFPAIIQGNRQIVRLVGGRTPQIIGFPVGVPVQDIADISSATAHMCGHRGQTFYVITFPTANVTIDDLFSPSLTLAFNTKAEEWSILGAWDQYQAQYGAYLGASFAYDGITRFAGGNDGKIYTLTTESRIDGPIMLHRWRNDGRMEWGNARNIPLGTIGDRIGPKKQRQCGRYYKRQDEFIFANGGTRTALRTGWRTWGKLSNLKQSNEYAYDLKRGDTGVVLDGIEEDITVVA